MIQGRKILALIPARGGSKGIRNKNIIDINGMPLIGYSIKEAGKSRYIDDIIVTTDDDEIQRVSVRMGAQVPFLRPKELATDKASTLDAVLHAVHTLGDMGKEYDILVLLQPTSPLRTVEDIDNALERFMMYSETALASASEVKDHPILMRNIQNDGMMTRLLNINSTVRRQDMPKVYRINGSIYINRISELNSTTSFNDNPLAYVMEQSHSVDIDEYSDIALVKYYLSERQRRNEGENAEN